MIIDTDDFDKIKVGMDQSFNKIPAFFVFAK